MAIILRSSKSVALTFDEMDGNFTDLNNRATTIENSYVKTINGIAVSNTVTNTLTIETNNITENSAALYHTDARARAAVSVTDSGGDGSLSYSNTTGILTYTGPSASEVRAHISAGEGIDISSGAISGEDASTSNKGIASFNTGDFAVSSGDVTIKVSGVGNAQLENSTVTLAGDSGSTAIDLGDTLTVTGGEGIDTAQSGDTLTISAEDASISNKGVASFSNDHFAVSSGAVTIKADGVDDTHIDFGTGANQVSTADLPEQTNLYYTDARVLTKTNATSIDALSDVDTTTSSPSINQVLTWTGSGWRPATAPGASGGEANTITNIGGYNELYESKLGTALRLRTINHDDNITITQSSFVLTIGTVSAPEFGNLKIGAANTIENISTNANIILKPNGTGVVETTGSVVPSADSTYNIGTNTVRYATVYADAFVGALTGNASGTALTVTQAAQTAITSVGTLTALQVDNININGNSITSTDTDGNITISPNGSGTVDVDTSQIVNVTDPTASQHASTKAYVDAQVSANSNAATFTATANNSTNETVYPVFVDAATGTQGAETDTGLTYNPSTGLLTSTGFSGTLTGTLQTAAQGNVTSLGTLTALTSGNITLNAQADLRFADSDSSNWVAFQAPATVASNITWTLPAADAGTSGFALVSNGSGTLSWAAAGATTTSDTSTNAERYIKFDNITSGAVTAVNHDAGLRYNPSTGSLTSAVFIGALTGNASGTAATVTGAAQANITSLGTLTTLSVDNITINGNTISSTAGTDLLITPLAGQQIVLDGTIIVDAGVVTAATSITSTAFVGALTGNADTATEATNITAVANNSTNETVYPTFVDGATGTQGIETDTGLNYNPSTGTLTTSILAGVSTSAQYADLAEKYVPDAEYPVGTVMTVGGGAEIKYCGTNDIPAGVISDKPAYLMNSEQEFGVPIALVGRVLIRVTGTVEKGQAVKATLNGVASVFGDGDRIGVALESSNDAGEKLIECLLKV